jgi:uncharacterized membrane protein
MSALTAIVDLAALLGTALVAGVFFAFSTFLMKALARLPDVQGIAAMQSINVVVINPWFLGIFLGTAALSVGTIVLAIAGREQPADMWLLAAAASYLVGTFLVTGVHNILLNDRLAATAAKDPAAGTAWAHYLERWTFWNHVRTGAATMSLLLYTLGLVQLGGA